MVVAGWELMVEMVVEAEVAAIGSGSRKSGVWASGRSAASLVTPRPTIEAVYKVNGQGISEGDQYVA